MATGKLIKKYRKLYGLTQSKLGEKIGLDDSRVRQYESGRRNPRELILRRFSDVFQVSTSYLKDDLYPYNIDDVMRFLFKMEDTLGVRISGIEVYHDTFPCKIKKTMITFEGESGIVLDSLLASWKKKQVELETGKITKIEYELWKADYPDRLI